MLKQLMLYDACVLSSKMIEMFFDGASKGNPGLSGAGCRIIHNNRTIDLYKFLGVQTNNMAEYNGLILGLHNMLLLDHKGATIRVNGDSKLVIEQMKGAWKVNSPNLIPLWNEAQQLASQFDDIHFHHIARKYNTVADRLANMAIESTKDH